MQLVHYNAIVLKIPCQPFDFSNLPFDPVDYAKELVKYMYDLDGLGLSSNQVGDNYAIFAMRGQPQNFVCINPRIVDKSEEQIILDEGCLSYKNLVMKIKRPRHIKVRFQTPNGETRTEKFTGMTARTFQHEYDHIMGRFFAHDVSRLKLENAMKKANKLGSKYIMKDFMLLTLNQK